jgi:hypothetical protein
MEVDTPASPLVDAQASPSAEMEEDVLAVDPMRTALEEADEVQVVSIYLLKRKPLCLLSQYGRSQAATHTFYAFL